MSPAHQAPGRGASIRIFLADGTAEGLRIVEKANWTGVGVACSRAQYPDVRKREEFKRTGIYLLIGNQSVDGGQQTVYVGEAETLRRRLDQQHAKRDSWTRLLAFTSKDESLNKAHGKYLESSLIELGLAAKRARLENGNAPPKPHLSEAEEADIETFLAELLVLCPLIGVTAFELPDPNTSGDVLELKGPDVSAQGQDTPEGFRVLAGSTGRVKVVPSIHRYMVEKRDQLIELGVLSDSYAQLRLTQDYVFDSPSTAAGVLLGRTANGRIEWKDSDGRTLKDLQDEAVQD